MNATLLACDNCVPGDQSGYYPMLAAVAGGGLALMALALVVTARAEVAAARVLSAVAAACSLVAGPGAVALAEQPIQWHSVTCGSALSASLERGVPDDGALDANQLGCKRSGRSRVGTAARLGGILLVGASIGLALSVGLVVGRSRRSPARSAGAAQHPGGDGRQPG